MTEQCTEQDSLLTDIITAAELHHKEFPELVQFVYGIVVEGFGIVAGPPKLGKSWWTLNLALAIAAGGRAFGKIPAQQRHVLLLALEDSPRRLQARIRAVYGSDIPPHRLHILTKVMPGLLIPTITAWLQGHPGGLVILDTLGRARQQRQRGDDAYLADYQAGVALKNVVDAFPGSALLASITREKHPATTSLTTYRAHSDSPDPRTMCLSFDASETVTKPPYKSPGATHPKVSMRSQPSKVLGRYPAAG